MSGAHLAAAIERVRDGVLFVEDDAVRDPNPAARDLLAGAEDGAPLTALPDPLAADPAPGDDRTAVTVGTGTRHLEVGVHPLDGAATDRRLVVLTDVTARRQLRRRLDSLLGNISDIVTVLDEGAG